MASSRILSIALLVSAALILSGCGGSQTAAGADVEKGRQIYETGGTAGLPCGSCHTLDGSELVGPSFQGIADRAGTRVEGVSAEEYLRQSIAEPDAYVVSGFTNTMPTVFSQTLSEEDIDNVIAFLLTR